MSNLNKRYNIKSIIDSIDGFEIILSTNNSKDIRVKFNDNIDAYRCVEEGLTLNLLNTLKKQYGKNFYTQWNFFKVENSEYIKWLANDYGGFDDEYAKLIGLKHYVFIDDNNILDVIARYEPKVEFIEN
ncbi:hypothetical protein ACFLYH_03740 [Candidatus Dependentiae bacterium]